MKNPTKNSTFLFCLLFVLGLSGLALPGAQAASRGTAVPEYITADTTWSEMGNPYQVDVRVIVMPGATLTIEPGVIIESAQNVITGYSFQVEGKLLAQGTAAKPIQFNNTPEGWSGLQIYGTDTAQNVGSVLEYVILDGGGSSGAGIGGNLVLTYSSVTVRHSTFKNSPGDGILVSWGGMVDATNVVLSNNAGYAINLKDGSADPLLANLSAGGNGPDLPYGGNYVAITSQGQLSGAHTWENMGLPYLIDAQVTTLPGSTLTIQPGVAIHLAPGNDSLTVRGRIQAQGTPGQQIRFLAADTALGWSGLQLLGPPAQPVSGHQFNHVLINRGGFGNACNLYLEYGAATINNSLFSYSDDSGVCLGSGASLTMADSQINNNSRYAMELYDPNAHIALSGLSASGNQTNAIGVWGGTLTESRAWPKSGINQYHLLAANLLINPEGALDLTPGVKLSLEYGREIVVQGTLTAVGEAANPIQITGGENVPGYWGGVRFDGTLAQPAFGRFTHVTMQYGGYGGSAMLELSYADMILDYCTLRHSSGDAIRILNPLAAAGRPAAESATPPLRVSWSHFTDLDGDAIHNLTDQAVMAAFNWWGAASGPTAVDNPGGAGSAITGPVLYRPFLVSPESRFIYLPLVVR